MHRCPRWGDSSVSSVASSVALRHLLGALLGRDRRPVGACICGACIGRLPGGRQYRRLPLGASSASPGSAEVVLPSESLRAPHAPGPHPAGKESRATAAAPADLPAKAKPSASQPPIPSMAQASTGAQQWPRGARHVTEAAADARAPSLKPAGRSLPAGQGSQPDGSPGPGEGCPQGAACDCPKGACPQAGRWCRAASGALHGSGAPHAAAAAASSGHAAAAWPLHARSRRRRRARCSPSRR